MLSAIFILSYLLCSFAKHEKNVKTQIFGEISGGAPPPREAFSLAFPSCYIFSLSLLANVASSPVQNK
jgi:hypothetical protein